MQTSSETTCPPRFTTPRQPERSTLGDKVAAVAKTLGTPLMPWQRHVVDVALEVDEAGLLAYREVDLTVPRQQGKSTLLLAVMVHRALRFGGAQTVTYTAQSRNAARKKWEDDAVAALERSTFGKRGAFTVRRSNGSEAILWNNGSRHGIEAPTETASHGETIDLGVIDEAFAHDDDRVEQALGPAMIARPAPQLWVVSTAGSARSAYLYRKVIAGRAGVHTAGSTAYFEWSAADDADPTDPAVWASCMPALGHTITERAVAAELERAQRRGELDLFRRAYLNQWVDVPLLDEVVAHVLPLEWWDDAVDKRSKVTGDRVFGVDLSPDRATAAIVVVGDSERDGVHVETIEHRPDAGSDWLVGRLSELVDRWPTRCVAYHASGPIGSLDGELQRALGDKARPVTDRELTAGCGQFHDAVRDGRLLHIGDPPIRAGLEGASKSTGSSDAWRWSRRSSTEDITALMAATAGWFAHGATPVVATARPIFAW